MQFDTAGQLIRRVRWFVCAPGAKQLPYASPFTSSNYGALAGVKGLPGEVRGAPRPWSNGATPAGLTGQNPVCGSADWWTNGTPSDAPGVVYAGDIPKCCTKAGYAGTIGAKAGLMYSPVCYAPRDWRNAYIKFIALDWVKDPAAQFGQAGWQIQSAPPNQYWTFVGTNINPTCPNGLYGTATYYLLDQQPQRWNAYPAQSPYDLQTFVFEFPTWNISPLFGPVLIRFIPPPYVGQLGARAGFVSQVPAYSGSLGARAGISSTNEQIYHGHVGALAGLVSSLHVSGSFELGASAGLASRVTARQSAQLGAQAGFASLLLSHYAAQLGAEAGLASQLHVTVGGTVGAKAGETSAVKATYNGTVGAKAGIASGTNAGIVTSCCPSIAIAITLHSLGTLGTPFTLTWNAASAAWLGTDPDGPFPVKLQCLLVGMTPTFENVQSVPHCTPTYTQLAKTCSHPFSVQVKTVMAGAICPIAGTYIYTIHE